MKIFLANAKAALLQVKTPALLGGVFLLLFWLWVFRDEDSDFVLLLFLGCVGGSGPFSTVRREIATRPFSFCLPRYRESLYEAVLCEAVLAGAAISLIGSRLAEERIPFNIGLWASGGFLVGTSLFLFGATARLIPALVTPVFDVVLSLPFCVAALAMLIVIAMYPPMFWFVGIAICAAIVTFVWVRFADRAAVMQAHRDLVTDAIKRHAPFVIEKPAYAWRERFFFDRIDRCRYLCAGRFLWGYLYCTFSWVLTPLTWWTVVACGIALVLGYAGRWVAEFAFVLLSLLALTVPLPVAFDVWLPAGRGERWYATIAGAVVTTSLLTIAAAGIAVLSWVLALLAPDIPLDGISLPYVGMSLWSLCLPSLLVPWLFLLRLLGHRMPIITAARGYMVLVFLVAAMAYPELVVGALRELRDPIVFACMLLGGWVIFLVVLRHACMKWDLLQNRARVPGISGGYR